MAKKTLNPLVIEEAVQTEQVEWWFFQGTYEGEKVAKQDFMISFFRSNSAKKDQEPRNSFSLLFSVLDYKSGKSKSVSQIDQVFLEDSKKVLQDRENTELDEDVIDVILKELEQFGPPQPITVESVDVILEGKDFNITWKDFKLSQDSEHLFINFVNPFTNQPCSIALTPLTPRFELLDSKNNKLQDGKTTYFCYPRMTLDGKIGEDKISGSAWMDHMMGGASLGLNTEEIKKVLGWDWFGINLNNGMSLLVITHKYAKTDEVLFKYAILIDTDNTQKFTDKFESKPLKYWESPVTHIIYPVEWEIKIEEFGIKLNFTPNALNQEIPIFGVSRAIWEGSGTVNGSLNGEEISGRARGEFYGYGYIFDFQDYLQRLKDRIDRKIEDFLPKEINNETVEKYVGKPYWKHEPIAYTEMISVPVWDLIARKGKRWRPIFGVLIADIFGRSSENYENSAFLGELIHNAALIIDDIEDSSKMRRGQSSIHIKYGTDIALNAGNTLYFLPYAELMNHEHLTPEQKYKVNSIWMNSYLEAHFGQTLDIYWSNRMTEENLTKWLDDSLEEKILQMYDYKTAAGPRGMTEAAAVIAETDDNIRDIGIEYTRSFCVAFQITDDIHNFSNSPKWTKICGEDLYNGKLTFVIVKALRNLPDIECNRLKQILCNKKLRENPKVLEEGIELVKSSNALADCRNYANKLSNNTWEEFSSMVGSSHSKIMLYVLSQRLLDLDYNS